MIDTPAIVEGTNPITGQHTAEWTEGADWYRIEIPDAVSDVAGYVRQQMRLARVGAGLERAWAEDRERQF